MWLLCTGSPSIHTDLTPGLPFLIPQKFHFVPSINAVSGSQELQWMVQPHFLGPSNYPRPLAYPQYSYPPPRPGVIRALGPPPGVRRRPSEQVRNRGFALVLMPSGVLRCTGLLPKGRIQTSKGGEGSTTSDYWPRRKIQGIPGETQRAKRSLLDQGGIVAKKDG